MHAKGKFYTLLIAICLLSYVWIAYSFDNQDGQGLWQGCLSKQFLHIPCPSCGITRSLISIIKGNFFSALQINPLGYVAAIALTIVPIWIVYDLITLKNSLFNTYSIALKLVKQKYIYIPLTLLIISNWIWNIIKYT